ncbi:MAG: NAD(P)-dependent oxidoreductase [Nitrospina sp.]|jgi:UDP-glucose 4-epimerase|nr:NAD(P)-dependent oxidoreductase [Nitrospina sp.]
MKILVLGGSGFLGSHVCDQLSKAGHKVRIFDLMTSPWLSNDQEMMVGDMLDENTLAKAISGCEVVYNFAAISDLDEALSNPIKTTRINVLGNVILLEACRKANIQRYIYASTLYVYSRDGGFYRCSKQSAEHYVEEYQRVYGLDYTILRYGSLYGPRSDNRNGLWRIVKNALDTGKVTYAGSPETMREYIHVEDAARSSVTILENDFLNQHVILTGQNSMKVMDLLKILAEILGFPQNTTKFIESNQTGHYIRTPYAYQPKLGRKYASPIHVDLGQGLLQLIEEVQNNNNEI